MSAIETQTIETVNSIKRKIGNKPVVLTNQIPNYYNYAPKFSFFWVKIDFSDTEVQLSQTSSITNCRETLSVEVQRKDFLDSTQQSYVSSLEPLTTRVDKITYKDWIGPHHPIGILLVGHDYNNLNKGLRAVHSYEKLARCGRTCIFEVKHSLAHIEYLRNEIGEFQYQPKPINVNATLLVGPQAWGSSIPLFSYYMLLIRAASTKPILPEESMKDYFKRIAEKRILYGNDSKWIGELCDTLYNTKVNKIDFYSRNKNFVGLCLSKYKYLSRYITPAKELNGYSWGISGLNLLIQDLQIKLEHNPSYIYSNYKQVINTILLFYPIQNIHTKYVTEILKLIIFEHKKHARETRKC